ncbi:MAG: hypothetical protein ABW170_04275 [Candidatus Thiodiazotropha sp. L084R]
MRVEQLKVDRLVELVCVDAHHEHEGLPSTIQKEWLGTKLKWVIRNLDGVTQIDFVHEGLVKELECYDICKQGWDYYFLSSLKQYLDTGTGTPYTNDNIKPENKT